MPAVVTLGAILESLMPSGTRPDIGPRSWQECPSWPPDAFAVAATIAERSGCYAEPGVVLSRDQPERLAKKRWASRAARLGKEWSETGKIPSSVVRLWNILFKSRDQPIFAAAGDGIDWKRAVVRLLAVADEACVNIGFIPELPMKGISKVVFEEYLSYQLNGTTRLQFPHSLCFLISASALCVLPKSLSPEVGCTLRSISEHLSLLSGIGVVEPHWDFSVPPPASSRPNLSANSDFNVLLIPFPYAIQASDFEVTHSPSDGADGYFTLNQKWLTHRGRQISGRDMLSFVSSLIQSAEQESGKINAIVFPEAALSEGMPERLSARLAARFPDLELVVAGVLAKCGGATRNQAVLISLAQGKVANSIFQNKHHRWVLDQSQIRQYKLERVLDPKQRWWERIDVHGRSIRFGLTRHEAVIAPLICEDLARFDPVLPVINAVGPNLVIALLMDGPQLESRWSGRYATVLAEDPGSAVLTFTCIGMVERARRAGEDVRRTIALWKQPGGQATEVYLPIGSHGVVLCLESSAGERRLLDFRNYGSVTGYRLNAVRPVCLAAPPAWLNRL